MKSLRRYLSLLFALVMSLNLFSVTALADSNDTDTTNWKANFMAYHYNTGKSFGQVNIMSGEADRPNQYLTLALEPIVHDFRVRYTFVNSTGVPLFKGGRQVSFTANNLNVALAIKEATNPDSITHNISRPTSVHNVHVEYMDGSTEYLTDYNMVWNDALGVFSLSCSFTPSKDVYKIYFYTSNLFDMPSLGIDTGYNYGVRMYYGTGNSGALPLALDFEVQTEEAGLLKGVLSKITDVWKTCEAGFANLVKGITELPQKLWNLIETGLKNLFVPSEEDMIAYKDKWDQLLSDRLGAVYEVGQILTESWDGVMSADETNTIEFPSASINLPGGNNFTFGGYTVQIVPNGFTFLVTALKSIIAIVCTIAFVNGMRKRYDEVMGVES